MARTGVVKAALAAAIPAVLIAGGLAYAGGRGPAGDSHPAAHVQAGAAGRRLGNIATPMHGAVAANIMHLPLVTSTGKATSLAAFHGKILMISDVMTLCQETCPLDTANLVQTARELDKAGQRKNVEFLSITFDPARDTPAQLAAYRKLYAPPPANWTLLTGTPTDIATLWKYLGLWYQKVPQGKPPATNWRTGKPLTYDLNHADVLYFVDGTGHKRFDITGPADIPPGTRLPKTMRGYLDAEGVGALKHPNGDTWTPKQALDVLRWLLNHTTTTAADTGGAPD